MDSAAFVKEPAMILLLSLLTLKYTLPSFFFHLIPLFGCMKKTASAIRRTPGTDSMSPVILLMGERAVLGFHVFSPQTPVCRLDYRSSSNMADSSSASSTHEGS